MAEVLSPPSATAAPTSQEADNNDQRPPQQPDRPADRESTTQPPPKPVPREPLERTPSFAQNRTSIASQSTRHSRPPSIFPQFQSHLSYASVRDFAYPPFHPNHHGPPPEPPSGSTTPGSEWNTSGRRLSDPVESGLGGSGRGNWDSGRWGGGSGGLYESGHGQGQEAGEPLPSTSFGSVDEFEDDGVRFGAGPGASSHRKSKSHAHAEDYQRGRRRSSQYGRRSQALGQSGGSEDMFHFGHGNTNTGSGPNRRDSHTHSLPHRTHARHSHHSAHSSDLPLDSEPNAPAPLRSSMSPSDEELFAGPSLALYSFEPENANELKLTEGQTILVSYRHGQGWLVAEDPQTGEQGLVPEEYVRLLREIEGWDEEGMEFDEDEIMAAGDEESGQSGELSGIVGRDEGPREGRGVVEDRISAPSQSR